MLVLNNAEYERNKRKYIISNRKIRGTEIMSRERRVI